jgi:C4-dicarboxylate transporter DctM subunit
MIPSAVGIMGIVVLIFLLVSRVPVGFAMLLVGFVGFGYVVSFKSALSLISLDLFAVFASYNMSVIPLFVFMGQIAFNAEMGRRLYYTAYKWLGHMPGGLAIATIGGCAGFAAICGSSPATAATMGSVALPEMRRYDYDPALATGSVAAGGTLGILIPPSIVLVVYGILTEQSIGKLLYAGVLPGILLSVLFVMTIYIWAQLNPRLGPPGPATGIKEKLHSLSGTVEMLCLFVLVMGGLLVGIFTPTEAGGVGALGALMIALMGRKLTWQKFINSLVETTWMTAMLLVIMAGATIFGRFLAVTRIPLEMAAFAGHLPVPRVAILSVIAVFYIIGGCLMEIFALVILTIPIFFPVIEALGFDPIWFGVMVVILCEMGLITPPVGVNVFVIKGMCEDIPVGVIFKGIIPFFAAMVVCLIILVLFPQIALFLPALIK